MTESSASSPLVVDVNGDSTVFGLTFDGASTGPAPGADGTVSSVVATPAPAGLGALLQAKYGPLVVVNNNGVSGTTFQNWLDGTGGVANSWLAYVAATPASVVLLSLGMNDEPAAVQAPLAEIVRLTQAAGKRLVLETPNAVDASWASAVIDDKAAMVRGAAQAAGLSLVDFNAETEAMGAAWHADLSYSEMFNVWSGIHPNQSGYDLMAQAMFATLDPIVGAALGYPTGTITVGSAILGLLMLVWTDTGGDWSCVNVLDAAGKGYWNGRPVSGISYAAAYGTAGEAVFALPAGDYLLELCAFWQGAWRLLGTKAVSVTGAP